MKIIGQNNFSLKKLMTLVLMIGTGGYMLSISWWKWPDILVDFGNQLYIPWQLNNGIVLYQDYTHSYGPLSPYLNSLLFKAFGTSIMTLVIFNILLIVVLSYLMYRIFIETTDVIVATFTITVFLGGFAFSQYVGIGNYNFVTPYSHNLTHGVILSFFSIYVYVRYLKQRKTIWLGIVGFSIGLVFLCKIEVFLAVSLSMVTGILLLFIIDRPKLSVVIKQSGVLILGFLLPIVFFLIFFSQYMPINNAVSSILREYVVVTSNPGISSTYPLYSNIMGRDKPIFNLVMFFKTAGWYVLVFSVFGITAFALSKFSATNKGILSGLTRIGIMAVSILFLIIQIEWFDMARALPLAMFVLSIYYFVSLIKHREENEKVKTILPLFVLTIFSGLLLLKMVLNVHVYHYGFALAMPATLLTVMFLLYHTPQFIGNKFGNADYVQMLSIFLVGTVIFLHINISRQIYAQKTFPVGSGGDIILTRDPEISPRGAVMELALEKISKIVKPDETLLVLPRGITLNYLARRVNPTPYAKYIPPQFNMLGEEKVLDVVKDSSPDYIALVEWDSTEHGARYFGKDYAIKLYSWIMENYTQVEKIGNQPFTGKGFGVVIMKRNEM